MGRKGKGVNHENTYVWDTIPLSRVPRVDVWKIHTDAAGAVWLGTTEGIFKYNPHVPKNYNSRQHTVLRKVKLLGDSTVFFGAFADKGTATVAQLSQFRFVLPHAIKSTSFEYAATSYDAPSSSCTAICWRAKTKADRTGPRKRRRSLQAWMKEATCLR